MAQAPSEFDLIAQLWAPLARGAVGAFDLKDDVAQLPVSTHGLVVTCDQVIEGTHFLSSDSLDWVAKRLVRRNLSDLIAKGCKPIGAFLALAWPQGRPQAQVADFARGLGDDLAALCGNCPLLGGDTSSIEGPLVASLTLIGTPLALNARPVLRMGAQPGDEVFLTGTLGDAYLGLQVRLGHMEASQLTQAVQLALAPKPPPLATANLVATYAKASIDVSDGLLADAGHVALASNVSLALELDHLPLSDEATAWLAWSNDPVESLLALATGGDDYQTLFCAAPEHASALTADFQAIGVQLTQIGRCCEGQGVALTYREQAMVLPNRRGWQFSDA